MSFTNELTADYFLLTPAIIEGREILSAMRTIITELSVCSDTAVTEQLSTLSMLLGISYN